MTTKVELKKMTKRFVRDISSSSLVKLTIYFIEKQIRQQKCVHYCTHAACCLLAIFRIRQFIAKSFFFSSHVTIVDFGLKFDLAGREAEKKWEVHTYTTPDFRSSKWIGALKIYHLFV
jgi:hypothetical protein